MDRDRAAFEKWFEEHCPEWSEPYEIADATWQAALAYAREGWKPIDDEALNGSRYLVCRDGGHVWIASYQFAGPRAGTRWQSGGRAFPFDPTHYMKIPAPPQPITESSGGVFRDVNVSPPGKD